MRNLKRVLSLALATVMLMGMMVMGASAADKKPLTDLDKVTNKEAVTLLVDLGIIEGKTDGSYAPAETVNRATMAKLITVMMMGDVDQNAYAGTSTDLTDVAGHWAEGYIKFCYSNKIIMGDGAGHFMPDQPVTTVAAAKMLLVALGYNAADRKYENDSNWSINIMRDAQSTKPYGVSTTRPLTKGTSLKATDSLSRDNAAQMIFNTLFVATQEPTYQWDNGNQYISKYEARSSMGDTTYGGLKRVTGTLTAYNATTGTATIGGKSVKLAASTADIGSNVVYYTDGADKAVSTVAVSSATEVLGTSTNGTAYSKLVDKEDTKNFIAEANKTEAGVVSVLYYINGATKVIADVETASAVVGNIVELIDNDGDGDIDLVKVTEKSIDFVDGDVQTRTVKGEEQINVPVTGMGWIDAEDAVGYEDLEDGDVVLYYTASGVTYFELAETITGKITGSKSSGTEIRVNGTYYGFSEIDGAETVAADVLTDAKLNTTDEFLFGLDDNGSIAYVEAITEEATVATAYVLDAAYVSGGGVGASKYVEVQLLLSDGTTEVYTVKKALGTDGTTELDLDDQADANALKGNFFKYSTDKNDKLTLTMQTDVDMTAGDKITNGKSVITKADGTTKVVSTNSKTVYFVKKGTNADNTTYSAYTGYNAVPSMVTAANADAPATTTNSKYVADNGIAKFVFIDTTAFVGDTDTANYIYLISTDYATEVDGDNTYYVYDVIMDGKKTTLSMDAALDNAVTVGLYKGITLTDEIATADDFEVSANKVTGVAYDPERSPVKDSIGNDIVVLNSKTYTYDSDTVVYMIIVDSEGGADVTTTSCDRVKLSNLDVYDYTISASTVKTDGELLSALYIVQTDAPSKD